MGKTSVLLLLLVVVIGMEVGASEAQLAYDYYKFSCPTVDTIVKEQILSAFLADMTAPAAFLRLMFHDCQVQGCDASILLDADDHLRDNSEMVSSKNFGIKKREVIRNIKSILEAKCPGQVSCADIIVLAAKESVELSGGPEIQIPLGRKDSTTCSYKQADADLPSPSITVDELLHIFMAKGMDLEESVAILGAHTLGAGHCINVVARLYDPLPDDQMDLGFEVLLRLQCPTKIPLTNLTSVPNDLTPTIFDNQYYRQVLTGKGLFPIDSRISSDPRTAPIVKQFATNQDRFFQVFSSAFLRLSSTNVLTGRMGEIRKYCDRVN